MFAKTLALAALTLVVAGIPTVSAADLEQLPCVGETTHSQVCGITLNNGTDAGCNPAPGFEAVCGFYNAVVTLTGVPLADAGCNAAETFEVVCVVYNALDAPLGDAGCNAAPGFEALCTVYDTVNAPLALNQGQSPLPAVPGAPAVVVHCVGLYPWSDLCQPGA